MHRPRKPQNADRREGLRPLRLRRRECKADVPGGRRAERRCCTTLVCTWVLPRDESADGERSRNRAAQAPWIAPSLIGRASRLRRRLRRERDPVAASLTSTLLTTLTIVDPRRSLTRHPRQGARL